MVQRVQKSQSLSEARKVIVQTFPKARLLALQLNNTKIVLRPLKRITLEVVYLNPTLPQWLKKSRYLRDSLTEETLGL